MSSIRRRGGMPLEFSSGFVDDGSRFQAFFKFATIATNMEVCWKMLLYVVYQD